MSEVADIRTRTQRFLEAHRPGEPLVVPNPWDVGSARLLASMGFGALATTSAGVARSRGRSDGAVGRDEALAHAEEIVTASVLPVTADLENGYGHRPEDVSATILAAAATGLAGGSIEDYTGTASNPIYSLDHSVERIAAAAEAATATGTGFVVTARAENHLYGIDDLEDTIRRLQAYADVGAHVVYAPGLPHINAVRTVTAAVDRPVNVLAGPQFTIAELADAGVARITTGSGLANHIQSRLLDAAAALQRGELSWMSTNLSGVEIERRLLQIPDGA